MSADPKPSAFSPFRHRAFAVLWSATLVANTGAWFRDVANGWLMTDLSPSPSMVALVQAATTLPVFLLALPAGALSDLVDRKWMLICIQVYMGCIGVGLALAVSLHLITPWLLLTFALLGGVGASLMGPAWQSVVPELVPRPVLRPAVALNALGVNIARAIGPALGGLTVAFAGAALAYWLDVACCVLIVMALFWWKRPESERSLPPERFGPALATGVRYILGSRDAQRVLLRSAAFFLFASAYWALLPLIARKTLGGDASLYGALLASIGAGAVTGALLLPRISGALRADSIILGGALMTAAAMAILALITLPVAAMAALFVAGAAWIAVLTTLNVTAQILLPDWVRARGLAMFITVFFGSMTAGSLLWGRLAEHADIQQTLLLAAAGGAGIGLLASRIKLPAIEPNLSPSMHWPAPATPEAMPGERGPVAVEITYIVAAQDRAPFLRALHTLAGERKRDGAYGWSVFEDVAAPERFVELFFAPSWLDHLRHHQRVTQDDADMQRSVLVFHQGPEPPLVRHLVAAHPDDQTSPRPLDAGDSTST